MVGALPFSNPKNTYTLAGDYHFLTPDDWGDLTLHGDWFWQSTVNTPNFNAGTGTVAQPAYGNLNATLAWKGVMRSHVDLGLWVKNALDATGAITQDTRNISVFSTETINYDLEPRLFGLTIRYNLH